MSDHEKPQAPPDEPKTPMWLPALGAALFLIVGVWWATGSSEPSSAPSTGAATAIADAGPG